ncbi:protein-glutamine gamma-glutamyltransferase 2 [Lates calcarifer]|uniref:Protein-glutamine gamma-glutamyltransferase 2 n=1 Tax=Lates calcarifer TaxID=8187 RepID=A0AAJ8B0L8_LATCA|nr:protein-glutamine gamma-glutamyltransferase 2 [Lates calcarifer]
MANTIKSVDFHCRSNNTAHYTIEISTKELIVRRGQSFLLTLNMTQPFNATDTLVLTVETGSFPSEKLGTWSEFGNPSCMYTSDVKAIWKYSFDCSANLARGMVTLSVTPPADAPVGKYSLSANTGRGKTPLGTLVVLFNPWCSDDWVFLPDERERQEYVLNEQGTIYVGTEYYPRPRDWIFGQFEEDMVDICLKILDVNPKHTKDPADDVSARCNPIYVSRVISAMINSNGDHGVLTGRWDGIYNDGERPDSWLGSVRILRKWYKTSCRPVKYGQCWVFAGVMCTVMRFFGIPCRVVTNFQSAHDTHNNLTIDYYHGENGAQPRDSGDSVWNYHVWVEGWMKRPDLKKGNSYDGWQVLDPTPQEKSEGVFCCGPAPVAAILQGDTNLKYDVPFVFAEVNADIVKWMVRANGSKIKMNSDSKKVGKSISTKAVGYNRRTDLTNNYKHAEGSAKEREVFKRAVTRLNSKDDQAGDGGEEPLKVEMKIEKETKIKSGQDIHLKLKLCNRDRTNRTMSIYINAQGMRYTGVPVSHILNTVQEKMLLSGQEVIVPIQIPLQTYNNHMVNCDSVKVSAVAIDKQNQNDIYESEIDISMEYPSLSMKVLGEARVDRKMTMEVEFTNTLNATLRNCSLTVTGSGMYKFDSVESNIRQLEPNATWKLLITTIPRRSGTRVVVADFDCSAFRDMLSSCIVDVKP